ncbi:MAG TPA: hypothetical protein VFB43_09660 [Terracidiphilus sp.]|nr:hypothetical protein [Terracidiphilus sp.]
MVHIFHLRFLLPASLGLAMLVATETPALQAQTSQSSPKQSSTPLPLKPDQPGTNKNHRLILKDGSYQLVRQYQIVGDRVRYLSQERDEWEELPADFVDWDATRRWERDHAELAADQPSPAMKEAADIDKEEAAERNEEKARMPEVAKGLELPDEEGVFVLDTFQGTPELVELPPKDVDVDAKTHRGLAILNPLAVQKAHLELSGRHAKVHLHVNDPAFYVSLGVTDQTEPVLSHPMTVDTSTAKDVTNGKHGAHSLQSGFVVVRLDQRQAVRVLGAIQVTPNGAVAQDADVIPVDTEPMPGKHWLKLQTKQKLVIGGEYALVEIISPTEISTMVWDFRVDPTEGDNPGSLAPILKQTSER